MDQWFTDGRVTTIRCDLQRFESVRNAAKALNETVLKTGYALINAGIVAMPDEATEDSFDTQMQTNHLSHFLLTREVTKRSKMQKFMANLASSITPVWLVMQCKRSRRSTWRPTKNLGGNGASMMLNGARWVR